MNPAQSPESLPAERMTSAGMSNTPVKTLFLGSGYAGHRTRFDNLRRHLTDDPRLDADWRLVTGWQDGGLLERMPGMPRGIRGRSRTTTELLPLLTGPRHDVVWSSVSSTDLALFAWTFRGPLRRPLILDLDWTLEQREELAPWYFGRPARTGVLATLHRAREAATWRQVTMFTPWSNWAADSLRRGGVEESRIAVMPPGVNVDYWRPARLSASAVGDSSAPVRLLFVGGDFRRKGGELLLEVMRGPHGSRLHLDIVTREEVASAPGVYVHRLNPNTPELQQLYQRADLFVLPSLAECYGIATIEAMASGLPVLVSDRGASREIVEHGRTGWLVEPTVQELNHRLATILESRSSLQGMGEESRAVAVVKFDGQTNDKRVAELIAMVSLGARYPRL